MEVVSLSAISGTDGLNRLTTSMFSLDSRSMLRSNVSIMSQSQFIGSDPSLGVSVVRKIKEPNMVQVTEVEEDDVILG
jgi:hypothetical protein